MSEDARTKILLAAEQLFAERGVEHVSMRQIGERAGQRNNSAVQYHFGNKSGLIQALYDLRLLPLNAERHRILEELDAPGPLELAHAYVRPLAAAVVAGGGSSCYARFLDRYLGRGRDFEPFDDRHGSGSREVVRQMSELLTDVDAGTREERLRMVQVLTIRTLADLEYRLETGQADAAAADLTVTALVDAIADLLESPGHARK
ncbi:TetR/AcrR family transcriptional regulator [Prescottella sp. R16]|uniref:TetR/AcrR family transcriptional regulator n=1 Tax=Prescottella sp. R16 TaxID=3064529 RepID=UPI00272E8E8D|nr:TetR/AcrR family transcriptional regulator [Prescottella sp. R16]